MRDVKVEISNGVATLSAGSQTHRKLTYINQNSPVRVRMIGGVWYVKNTTFFDGIRVDIKTGHVINYPKVMNLTPRRPNA